MIGSKQLTLQKAVRNVMNSVHFSNRWVKLSSVERAVKTRYQLTGMVVSKATISRHVGKLEPDISNLQYKHHSGIYKSTHLNDTYFFFQDPPASPPLIPPPYVKPEWDKIVEIDNERLQIYISQIQQMENRHRPNKKRRMDDIDVLDSYNLLRNQSISIASQHAQTAPQHNYWDSPEAKLLFNPNPNENTLDCLIRRVTLLANAVSDDDVLKHLINDSESFEIFSSKKKEWMRTICLYLKRSYENAIQYMNLKTWSSCVKLAIEELADIGVKRIKNDKTIRRWNIRFRASENLNIQLHRSEVEPKIFCLFPEAKTEFIRYCNSKVKSGELSTEAAYKELSNSILPRCYSNYVIECERNNSEIINTYEDMLQSAYINNLSYSSTWRWLRYLGFNYGENRRSYYTDGHEREDVKRDRDERFLDAYFDSEIQCHRWVQISSTMAVNLKNSYPDFAIDSSHYFLKDGIEMQEYHVDTHECLSSFITEENKKFGGNLSVRRDVDKKPLMIIGQDESTYNQLVFSSKYWRGSKGLNFITPKNSGEIMMISGYQCREFGLGLGDLLTPEILLKINENRKNTSYLSKKDAMLVFNSDKKSDIVV